MNDQTHHDNAHGDLMKTTTTTTTTTTKETTIDNKFSLHLGDKTNKSASKRTKVIFMRRLRLCQSSE